MKMGIDRGEWEGLGIKKIIRQETLWKGTEFD